MFKKIFIILFAGICVFGISKLTYAISCHGQGEQSYQQLSEAEHSGHEDSVPAVVTQVTPKAAQSVGNKICPVTGEKIDEKTTYEYQGKIYNFCCPACVDEFKKDPAKYIKKIEEEKKELEMKMQPESRQGHIAL